MAEKLVNTRKIRLAQSAKRDLEAIWEYTVQEWGEEQAEKYIGLIEKGLSQLLDNPYLGKPRSDIKEGYRALQVEKHLVFYRLAEEDLNVIGVVHVRMDAKRYID